MVLRLRVGLLHICNVVVKDGLLSTLLRDTPKLKSGFGRTVAGSSPKFFKEGEFVG